MIAKVVPSDITRTQEYYKSKRLFMLCKITAVAGCVVQRPGLQRSGNGASEGNPYNKIR